MPDCYVSSVLAMLKDESCSVMVIPNYISLNKIDK